MLEKIRIVEIADLITGPYCTKLFADLGAEVIKIEAPGCGDRSRKIGPFPNDIPHPEKSGLYIYLNSNKKSVTVNIESTKGRKILHQLLADADVFVVNQPLKLMKALELDYHSLKKIYDRLIVASISPWGQNGQYRHQKAHDINIAAGGGIMARLGLPEREPLAMPASQGSYYPAVSAAAAIMLAVYARTSGFPAQHLDLSQMRSWGTTYSIFATAFLTENAVTMRTGDQMPDLFPYTVLPVKGGRLFMGTIKENEWKDILKMMGDPEWGDDPRFENMYTRFEHREELKKMMAPWLQSKTKEEISELAEKYQLEKNCIPVNTVEDVINSEHLQSRSFFVETDHPLAGKIQYPGLPYKITGFTPGGRNRAPILGENNEEIFCGRLGYSEADLVKFKDSGII